MAHAKLLLEIITLENLSLNLIVCELIKKPIFYILLVLSYIFIFFVLFRNMY